jgi:Spy/CpxP family protein refolding chaperone
MSLLRHWKVILSMTAIFAVGVVTGALLIIKIGRQMNYRNSPEGWAPLAFSDYRARLKLTPEQTQKIKPILDQAGQDIRAARGSSTQEFVQIIRRANDDITPLLSPEQQKTFDEMKNQARERWKARMQPPRPKPPEQ